jgi:hypothetical protein
MSATCPMPTASASFDQHVRDAAGEPAKKSNSI